MGQGGSFRRRGSLIEQGGVGDFQAGQFDDHGLKIQQCLQTSLRNFGLIGGVGRVPAWILQHIAADHMRGEGSVVAQADEGASGLVEGKNFLQVCEGPSLRSSSRQFWRGLGRQALRQGFLDQLLETFQSKGLEHFQAGGFIRAQVAGEKRKVGGIRRGPG